MTARGAVRRKVRAWAILGDTGTPIVTSWVGAVAIYATKQDAEHARYTGRRVVPCVVTFTAPRKSKARTRRK